jgi:hypothetical protein
MSQTNKLKKRKAKSPTPPDDPSVGASTSTTPPGDSRGGITTEDVLQNTNALPELLKSVSDAAEILGLHKLLQSNSEDLKNLAAAYRERD